MTWSRSPTIPLAKKLIQIEVSIVTLNVISEYLTIVILVNKLNLNATV